MSLRVNFARNCNGYAILLGANVKSTLVGPARCATGDFLKAAITDLVIGGGFTDDAITTLFANVVRQPWPADLVMRCQRPLPGPPVPPDSLSSSSFFNSSSSGPGAFSGAVFC